jgi:hypothetical protein
MFRGRNDQFPIGDEKQQFDVAEGRTLVGLLANGVRIHPGDNFPFRWNALGYWEYVIASHELVQEARNWLRIH